MSTKIEFINKWTQLSAEGRGKFVGFMNEFKFKFDFTTLDSYLAPFEYYLSKHFQMKYPTHSYDGVARCSIKPFICHSIKSVFIERVSYVSIGFCYYKIFARIQVRANINRIT